MKKNILILLFMVLCFSCEKKLKVKKIISNKLEKKINEIYLVSDAFYPKILNDSILLNKFTKKRVIEICKSDTNINLIVISFYDDVSCTRYYYKNYKKLKKIEHVTERCGDIHTETYIYELLTKEKQKIWHLKYSKNNKHTIHCK